MRHVDPDEIPPTNIANRYLKTAAGVGLASLLWHYRTAAVQSPAIFVGEGALKQTVLPQCSYLLNPFVPTIWASNRHMQTVIGLLRKNSVHGRYRRQPILASDGGSLALDWWSDCDKAAFATRQTPVFLVLHGINGGSHEGYCKWACVAAAKRGWRAVVLNYRGCNGVPLTSPRGYAATMTHDVARAVASIKGLYPDAPLLAAGYSLVSPATADYRIGHSQPVAWSVIARPTGGIILTKYLAEAEMGMHGTYTELGGEAGHHYEGSGMAAAAVVSSPICMDKSSDNLTRPGFSFLYNLAIAYKLREYMSEHRADIEAMSGPMNIGVALSKWTMKEIEDQGLAAQYGYASRLEYYGHASSLEYIPSIRTPTLMLLSADDPFLGVRPDAECAGNPFTLLAVTARGGHVAFLQGLNPLGTAYMDDAVMQFLDSVLKHYPAGTSASPLDLDQCAAPVAIATDAPADRPLQAPGLMPMSRL